MKLYSETKQVSQGVDGILKFMIQNSIEGGAHYMRRAEENCPAASTSDQLMPCMRWRARLRTWAMSLMTSLWSGSMLLLLPLFKSMQGAGGIRAAEGSRRGSRREATGSLGWNMFTMEMRSSEQVSDEADADAATAAAGAGCVGANGLKCSLKARSSCCKGRNMPRGEPMQIRH